MCSNESPPPSKEPLSVGLGIGNPMAGFFPGLEHYRLQLYHYAMTERLRLAQQLHPQHPGVGHPQSGGPTSAHLGMAPGFPAPLPLYPAAAAAAAGYPSRLALSMALLHPHHQRIPEEPKPQHSYIGLIAMAILSSPDKKLVLSDIYQHILEHYPYFRTRGPGWRNSIRHNLSLNDCFVKSGRSANGKGHYWAIHPANLEDFRRGDFRRRKAQRKVRKHMGLAVDEEPDSPSPPPLPATPPPSAPPPLRPTSTPMSGIWSPHHHQPQQQQQQQHHQDFKMFQSQNLRQTCQPSRKRQFDVASLLAPDDQLESLRPIKTRKYSCSEDEHDLQEPEAEADNEEEDVDVDVDVDVDGGTEAKPLLSPVTPSASPESKMSPINGHCNWSNPALQSNICQPISGIHLHNHLHVRNYYVPSNSSSGSSI